MVRTYLHICCWRGPEWSQTYIYTAHCHFYPHNMCLHNHMDFRYICHLKMKTFHVQRSKPLIMFDSVRVWGGVGVCSDRILWICFELYQNMISYRTDDASNRFTSFLLPNKCLLCIFCDQEYDSFLTYFCVAWNLLKNPVLKILLVMSFSTTFSFKSTFSIPNHNKFNVLNLMLCSCGVTIEWIRFRQ